MQFEDPLFHIHLNVDYPFNLTGILYFPRMAQDMNIQKDKIQLYQNQVYVTDNVEGIVPEFVFCCWIQREFISFFEEFIL